MNFDTRFDIYVRKNVLFLGGGLPIGSILLIEEDKIGRYAKCLSKLFLAEGIVHKHALFLANLDQNPQEMVIFLHLN